MAEEPRRVCGRLRLGHIMPSLSPTTWVTTDKITQTVLWLVVFSIVAPILGPRPYGLFSIVMVFVGVSELILSEGTVEALVTVDELDRRHMSTANLVSGALALALTLLTSGLAPAIATLFDDADLKNLLWALAPLPVLSTLSATPTAILRRSLKYKQLAVRNIAGLMIGGICGIVLAVAGAGVWALALQALAQRLAEVTIVWLSVPVRMEFGWSKAHFRDISPVGMNVLTGLIMTFASGQLPRLVIGYVLGATDVGLFALANRFLDLTIRTTVMPRTAVGRIELRDAKPGSAEFVRIFSEMTQHASILAFPVFCGAAALSPDLFRVWLNHRWMPGVVPTQLMLISGVPLAFFYCIDSAFLGAKQSSVFKWTATLQTLTIMITVLCVAPFGLDMICLSLAIRSWVLLPIFLLWFRRACRLSVYTALRPALYALVGAVIMAALLNLPFLRPQWFSRRYDFIFLVIIGTAVYTVYLRSFARDQLKAFLGEIFSRRT
jgi:O-antigen/teichoic acid export membrane protein